MAKKYWLRLRRMLAQRVLHTDDTPHTIGLGAGIATFVAFLPLVGFQTIISIALAALFRANKAICIPIVWITNFVTIVPIYGACLVLGRFVTGAKQTSGEEAVISTLQQQHSTGLLEPSTWWTWFSRLANYGVDLWVGCIIVGTVLGIAGYFITKSGVVRYRERRRQRILRRGLFRSNFKAGKAVRHDGSA